MFLSELQKNITSQTNGPISKFRFSAPQLFKMCQCETRGKPSTRLPRGELVEQIHLTRNQNFKNQIRKPEIRNPDEQKFIRNTYKKYIKNIYFNIIKNNVFVTYVWFEMMILHILRRLTRWWCLFSDPKQLKIQKNKFYWRV